jgi:tetratricopeptide (TPR) repeat protein
MLFCLGLCILYACSSQKDTATSRAMQNLTSRYNYIYNANLILNDYIAGLQETHSDNFSELLPVYINPPAFNPAAADPILATVNSKELDEIIQKAQTLIADKSYGNYIDDAYLLLGKAYFYKGNYFIAAEYFDYTARTYKKDKKTLVQALNWKTRSYMQLSNVKTAAAISDTLETKLDSVKHNRAEPFATLAQMSMDLKRNKEAIPYLQSAIKASNNQKNKIRWTYILAQLFEGQNDAESALKCYRKVQSSNAGFDLYFNANLSHIKLSAQAEGKSKSRTEQLRALLKDDKNADFLDQVYYNIANVYSDEHDYSNASDYYNRAIRISTANPYQKGLAYLKLADLNFNQLRNYVKAKAYYDSAVNTLPKAYPNYDLIARKNKNLQYLTDRYQLIAFQDSLQAFARIPEKERIQRVQRFQSVVQTQPTATITQISSNPSQVRGNGTFYFDNQNAMDIGLVDFRRKWGNRKQEDNWRQSVRTSEQANTQKTLTANIDGIPSDPDQVSKQSAENNPEITALLAAIPVNSVMQQASDQKIIKAYYEIASFYQQELNDSPEAIRIYQILLNRYPDNNFLPAINYSLYLTYKDRDPKKAEQYKNVVLSRFGNSVYAKTILDPSFSIKQSELDRVLESQYNRLFSTYQSKDFTSVIKTADQLAGSYPGNYLLPQFEYLKAIAIGRTQHVDSLIAAFTTIKTQFPGDQLIVPLVDSHLAYINAHLSEFKQRKIALTDFDPNEPPFSTPQAAVAKVSAKPLNPSAQVPKQPTVEKPASLSKQAELPKQAAVDKQNAVPVPAAGATVKTADLTVPKPNSIFSSTSPSNTYYFVVDVADASLTLSSSRFGIGQFNRGNYGESNLRHQLVEFDDDQLIYVGNFSSFEAVKQYAEGIVPQLKKIMKVPEAKYSAFIISKENFEKLKSKALVNQYLDFYKTNY